MHPSMQYWSLSGSVSGNERVSSSRVLELETCTGIFIEGLISSKACLWF